MRREERASPLRSASLEAEKREVGRPEDEGWKMKAKKLHTLAEGQKSVVTPVKTGVQSVCECLTRLDSGLHVIRT